MTWYKSHGEGSKQSLLSWRERSEPALSLLKSLSKGMRGASLIMGRVMGIHESAADSLPNSPWDKEYDSMAWLPGGWLNAAHEIVDRHARGRLGNRTALVWVGRNGEVERYTFRQIKALSDRFANVLGSLGVVRGDTVLIYLDRIPELYFAYLGALKSGAVAGFLSPDLGPEPVRARMAVTAAKILVTQPGLRRRMGGIVYELFDLQHIVIVNKNGRDPGPPDIADLVYEEEMSQGPRRVPHGPLQPARRRDRPFQRRRIGNGQGRRTPPPGRRSALRHRAYGPGPARGRRLLVHRSARPPRGGGLRHRGAVVQRRQTARVRGSALTPTPRWS